MAVLGIWRIFEAPLVLKAVLPIFAIKFLVANNARGFLILDAVFLVATGAEALYADMEHFGKTPIKFTWITVVFPALVLNYFGQGAFLLKHPDMAHNVFFAMAPYPFLKVYLLLIATIAT